MSLRAFVPDAKPSPQIGDELVLDRDESHYLARVRRVRKGDTVELLDGVSKAWFATVLAIESGGRSLRARVERPRPESSPGPRRTLFLGQIDKAAALEAITDATVVGVDALGWVDCARSQGHLPSDARVQRAIRAAQRQCGRATRPTLHHFVSLQSALEADFEGPLVWAALARGEDPAPPTPAHLNAALRLAIGPEGGFDPAEVALLRAHAAMPLRLGPWVLRSERALVAALARLFPDPGRPPSP